MRGAAGPRRLLVMALACVIACAIGGAIAACGPGRRAEVPLPPLDPTRLSHTQHAPSSHGL
jgi:hypothetical protein